MLNFSFHSPKLFLKVFSPINASCRIVLLMLLLIPGAAFAQSKTAIGDVIITVGHVEAISQDKNERTLKRGNPFYTLEMIVVEAASKAQLKFTDGGIINLIASTKYQVDSYVFKQADQTSQSISNLIEGGFRAVSGDISKENPSGTIVKTPVAVMGLRGTVYEALLANENLFTGCEEGTVSISNALGEVEIGPSSNTRYAIVMKGKAPKGVKDKPSELAAVSFDVEAGEPNQTQQIQSPALTSPQLENETYGQPFPENGVSEANASIVYPDEGIGAYDGSQSASYIAPTVALGTLSIAGIIAIVSQYTHHHSSSSSSYTSHSSHSHH